MTIQWKSNDRRVRSWEEAGRFHVDVRELLLGGGRPFAQIMGCVAQMTHGDVLVIHAPFEPQPLIAQLEKRGLRCESRREGEDHWTLGVFA